MGNFDKPAIFGEAGADLAYYSPKDKNYHISYHNQLWASLSNGLAATPVWWDYPILNDDDWDQLQNLAGFVSDLDLANQPYQPLSATSKGADLYVMGTSNNAFGWGRSYEKENISGSQLNINGLDDGAYTIIWYDTWSGKLLKSSKARSQNGNLILQVPEMRESHPDVAFKILEDQDGSTKK